MVVLHKEYHTMAVMYGVNMIEVTWCDRCVKWNKYFRGTMSVVCSRYAKWYGYDRGAMWHKCTGGDMSV